MRPFSFLGRTAAAFLLRVVPATVGLGGGSATLTAGEAVHFASGPARVSLIELYTSEGCSSCPPAEKWLGQLRDRPGLWRDFVPVAFHVDYWNRLGWPDRFSKKEFTQREYDYAAAWSDGSVYTPCFVRDGAEWRLRGMPSAQAEPVGTLTVDYEGTMLTVAFSPAGGTADLAGDYEVHAAVLGAGIVSRVTAGENRGETLKHDFIALSLARGALGRALPLPVPSVTGVPRHALAVWVTKRGSLVPVQAAGQWLD